MYLCLNGALQLNFVNQVYYCTQYMSNFPKSLLVYNMGQYRATASTGCMKSVEIENVKSSYACSYARNKPYDHLFTHEQSTLSKSLSLDLR